MEIVFEGPNSGRNEKVHHYVRDKLDGSSHERGALEAAEASISTIRQAFGQLVEKLAAKGLLDARDIMDIVGECYSIGSSYPKITLEPDPTNKKQRTRDAFNEWWNKDSLTQTNPYEEDTPVYWAWEGWAAACRKFPPEPIASGSEPV